MIKGPRLFRDECVHQPDSGLLVTCAQTRLAATSKLQYHDVLCVRRRY